MGSAVASWVRCARHRCRTSTWEIAKATLALLTGQSCLGRIFAMCRLIVQCTGFALVLVTYVTVDAKLAPCLDTCKHLWPTEPVLLACTGVQVYSSDLSRGRESACKPIFQAACVK